MLIKHFTRKQLEQILKRRGMESILAQICCNHQKVGNEQVCTIETETLRNLLRQIMYPSMATEEPVVTNDCVVCETKEQVGKCGEFHICFTCYNTGKFRKWLNEKHPEKMKAYFR